MKKYAMIAAALAASSLVGAMPAQAACWSATSVNAAKLRNLDIMLMVTALRCRMGPDNFQPDYYAFAAAHQAELNVANRQLRTQLASESGKGGPDRALDKMSTRIANSYGTGHPTMGCRDLKSATRSLAQSRSQGTLLAAADAMVGKSEFAGRTCGAQYVATRR